MIDVNDFLQLTKASGQNIKVEYARVDINYTSGRPKLIFDGETVVSGKAYPYLSSYAPAKNDRVMLINGVIMGKVI